MGNVNKPSFCQCLTVCLYTCPLLFLAVDSLAVVEDSSGSPCLALPFPSDHALPAPPISPSAAARCNACRQTDRQMVQKSYSYVIDIGIPM